MATITPQTNIMLVKCPLTLDNKNQITFANKEAQYNYFNSLEKYEVELDDSSYQRKDGFIRFPAHIDEIMLYNYVMYQNENYSNKWFYAYITGMEYVNRNLTNVYIQTDVWQTWQFDINFKESFVEREMIAKSEDIPGSNLLPETLETGEYIINARNNITDMEMVSVVAYSGTEVPVFKSNNTQWVMPINQGAFVVNGNVSTVAFLLCNNEDFSALMTALQDANYSDFIVACFSVPKLAVEDFLINENKITSDDNSIDVYCLQSKTGITNTEYNQKTKNYTLDDVPNSIDGYTPRNKKLLTYPYVYIGFNPPNGSTKIFRFEDFEGIPGFKIISEVNPNPTICLIPQNYRGQSGDSLSDLVQITGYPTLASKTDTYNIWLAQNSEIINLQMKQEEANYNLGQIGASANMVNSALKLNSGGIIESSINARQQQINYDYYVKLQMAQVEKQQMLPDNVNLSSSGATLLGYGKFDDNIFTVYTIKQDFAKRIDKYFNMYGYLTNNVKVPNLNNRSNWNYIKTIGANILGNIPQEDLQTIKNFFDNGITLWHTTTEFLDYSKENN